MVERVDRKHAPTDLLSFADRSPADRAATRQPGHPIKAGPDWKMLIVDDEQEVHQLTRLVLKNYEFEARGLHMLSAYSGGGARDVLREHPDVAVILLDVVMEQEDAGLRLIRYIREELNNHAVRIILRTGQPGQAPEQEVVSQYDINDYQAKTELTSQKLYTAVTSALRAWRDIQSLARKTKGLQRIIDSSPSLFEWHSRTEFVRGILKELVNLAGPDNGEQEGHEGLTARKMGGEFTILAGTGRFQTSVGRHLMEVVPETTRVFLKRAERHGSDCFHDDGYLNIIRADNDEEILFLLKSGPGTPPLEEDLIRIYMSGVAMAFHNVNLNLEIIDTQKEIIHTLGEVVETRSKETANHVLRVGKMAQLLAQRAGLDAEEAAILRLAAPMHDVGKVGIPDAVLNKPGALTGDEYTLMKTHTTIGGEILGKSRRRIMKSASLVARQHHERWDGLGYPAGLAGENIHIFGRIVALVDVFDAVINKRCYRDAKELGEVVAMLKQGRGTHFDPFLTDIFLANLTEFLGIVKEHPDREPAAVEERKRMNRSQA